MLGVMLGKFFLASVTDCVRKVAGEVAEEWKRLGRAPFLPHVEQRRAGLEQQHGERGGIGVRLGQSGQPFTNRTVADLIVVLKKIDERGAGKAIAWLATLYTFAMRGGLALVGKALRQDASDVLGRLTI